MAVAVVHGGKTVYAKGFGVKDVSNGDGPTNKVDADTVFQLASVSKPLGATVVAHQVGAERDQLGHPGGVEAAVVRAVGSRPSPRWSPSATCTRTAPGCPTTPATSSRTSATTGATCWTDSAQLPLDPFRISYAYTNFGVTAGGRGGGRQRGQVVGGPRRRGAVPAAGHGVDELRGSPTTRPGRTGRSATSTSTASTSRVYVRDADAQAPAGGVSSSVNDMTHWLAMMLANGTYEGKQIVDPKALLPAVTPQIVSSPRERAGDAVAGSTATASTSARRRRPARSSATPAHSNSARAPTS